MFNAYSLARHPCSNYPTPDKCPTGLRYLCIQASPYDAGFFLRPHDATLLTDSRRLIAFPRTRDLCQQAYHDSTYLHPLLDRNFTRYENFTAYPGLRVSIYSCNHSDLQRSILAHRSRSLFVQLCTAPLQIRNLLKPTHA